MSTEASVRSAGTAWIGRIRRRGWSIPIRSAVVAASVVAVALILAGGGMLLILRQSLTSSVDDAAAGRIHDIAMGLHSDSVAGLDRSLLRVEQRIAVVQIVNANGVVVAASAGAASTPAARVGTTPGPVRRGISHIGPDDADVRASVQTVDTPSGRFTIIVGAGSALVESTEITVGVLLAIAGPLVVAVAGVVTYLLVKRSLQSVEAIRSRVAEISASDLGERVPLPRNDDEITALARTMNSMLVRLEDSHNAQRQFIGDASHELRSPLATVISTLEVAAAHPEVLDSAVVSDTLLPETHRMHMLVENLLTLARADESSLVVLRDEVDLDELATEELDRLRAVTTIAVTAKLAPVRVIGDGPALSQVLRNLLENAVRFATSRVNLETSVVGTRARVAIRDDGPGIAVADRERVFDRFVRLDSSRARSNGGTGLGLAIVKEIVQAHNGSVRFEDSGRGETEVIVELPLR